jgi:putative intracellular protease/amidase
MAALVGVFVLSTTALADDTRTQQNAGITGAKNILMVVTSADRMNNDEPTGLWLEEFAVPYLEFVKAGFEVTVASPKGGAAPIDPRSEATDEQAESWSDAAKRLQHTVPLKGLKADGRRFGAVVVDPPAFVKRRKDHRQGLAAYQRINQLALALVERDGLLVSCSCSHHVSVTELLGAIERAARHVDRFVQVLEIGGQAADHPIHPAIAETRYLKAVFCRVLPA